VPVFSSFITLNNIPNMIAQNGGYFRTNCVVVVSNVDTLYMKYNNLSRGVDCDDKNAHSIVDFSGNQLCRLCGDND